MCFALSDEIKKGIFDVDVALLQCNLSMYAKFKKKLFETLDSCIYFRIRCTFFPDFFIFHRGSPTKDAEKSLPSIVHILILL